MIEVGLYLQISDKINEKLENLKKNKLFAIQKQLRVSLDQKCLTTEFHGTAVHYFNFI